MKLHPVYFLKLQIQRRKSYHHFHSQTFLNRAIIGKILWHWKPDSTLDSFCHCSLHLHLVYPFAWEAHWSSVVIVWDHNPTWSAAFQLLTTDFLLFALKLALPKVSSPFLWSKRFKMSVSVKQEILRGHGEEEVYPILTINMFNLLTLKRKIAEKWRITIFTVNPIPEDAFTSIPDRQLFPTLEFQDNFQFTCTHLRQIKRWI